MPVKDKPREWYEANESMVEIVKKDKIVFLTNVVTQGYGSENRGRYVSQRE